MVVWACGSEYLPLHTILRTFPYRSVDWVLTNSLTRLQFMSVLAISVIAVLLISAACSISEAALYAVRMSYIRQLSEAGRRAGALLSGFKKNMEQPITAILIVNTAANTAGAAIAGSQARTVLGPEAILWFSAAFTVAVLVLSEIVPKVIGVGYNKIVAPIVSAPLRAMVIALYPFVRVSTAFAKLLTGGKRAPLAPEDEVWQFAALSAEEGSILPIEAALVKNVLRLNEVTAGEIMTPLSVVYKVSSDARVGDLSGTAGRLPFSRIPIFDANDPSRLIGIVLRRDVLHHVGRDELDVEIRSLSQRLFRVREKTLGDQLLHAFLRRRRHMFAVLDDDGNVTGVVTLEDVLEALIGQEIVDETDAVIDMREEAERLDREPQPGHSWLDSGARPNRHDGG